MLIQNPLGFWRRAVAAREHKGNHALNCSVKLIMRTAGNSVWRSPWMHSAPWPNHGIPVKRHRDWTHVFQGLNSWKQLAMLFHHGEWRICSKTFQKLHGMGKTIIIKGGGMLDTNFKQSKMLQSLESCS